MFDNYPMSVTNCPRPLAAGRGAQRMYDDLPASVTHCPRRLAAKAQHSELVCHCEECKARRGNPFPFSRSDNVPCPKRGADCHASVRYFSQRHSFHLPKNNIRKFYYNMEKRKKQRFTAGEGRAYYQQGNGCGSAADGAEGAVQAGPPEFPKSTGSSPR